MPSVTLSMPAIKGLVFAFVTLSLHVGANADGDAFGKSSPSEMSMNVAQLQRYGDTTYVSRADGSYAVLHRYGDVSVVSDSRPGMSGMMAHYGDMSIYSYEFGNSVCNTQGETMWCT
jgi:hypothetical protein